MLLIMSHKRNELSRKMSCFSSVSNMSQRVQEHKSICNNISVFSQRASISTGSKVNGILTWLMSNSFKIC